MRDAPVENLRTSNAVRVPRIGEVLAVESPAAPSTVSAAAEAVTR